jgi:hypothetical protein
MGIAAAKIAGQIVTKGHTTLVKVKPNDIREMPELFQQRTLTYGKRTTDRIHVKALQREISIHGQLDPIVLIKVRRIGWVVTQGHHRLAAYKAEGKGDQPIICQWFKGDDVWAAVADSIKQNNPVKKNVGQADRQEQAWKLTLQGWPEPGQRNHRWSADQLRTTCSVSKRQVFNMRAVVEAAMSPQDEQGKRFRERLCDVNASTWDTAAGTAAPLKEASSSAETLAYLKRLSWAVAGGMWRGATKEEISHADQAMKLARVLNGRIADELLKYGPAVMAQALEIYNPDLPEFLLEAWLPKHLLKAWRKWRSSQLDNYYYSLRDDAGGDRAEVEL